MISSKVHQIYSCFFNWHFLFLLKKFKTELNRAIDIYFVLISPLSFIKNFVNKKTATVKLFI